MPSVHDSLLTGYTVDGARATIVMRTEPHQGGGEARIDVEFTGVVGYHFEGDLLQNIVFDIKEVEPSEVVGDGTEFANGGRLYGWMRGWDTRRESAVEFLAREKVRTFAISCSYGMSGWVAAASMTFRVKP